MNDAKIEHRIAHLKDVHRETDKELKEAQQHWDEILIHKLKQKKLKLKDEIERFNRMLG